VTTDVDLEFAHALRKQGVPVFTARLDAQGNPMPPPNWQVAKPNAAAVRRPIPGRTALCAVTGVIYDVIDIDPRNGGRESFKRLSEELGDDGPEVYAEVKTPSGGKHLYIATLGIRKCKPLPGIDLQAGDADGEGRGFVFLPPTVRPSKVTGERRAYRAGAALRPVPAGDAGSAALRDYGAACLARHGDGEPGGRTPIETLHKECIAAEAGGQRDALLRYVHELERMGYVTGEIIRLTTALTSEMPTYDRRHPWTERHVRGLLHRPGAVTPDAVGDEAAELDELRTLGPRASRAPARRGTREDEAEYRRQKRRRNVKARLDAEDRAAVGDAGLFEPVDLLAVAEPPPLRLGAEGIFPLGAVSALVGTHNTGKSPLIAFTGLRRIRAGWSDGEMFGVYEQEMGPVKFKRLLRDLGATDEEIRRFRYYSDMMRPVDLVRNGRALCERAWADGCRTVAYDSLISMLAVSGLDENNPVHVRSWYDAAARPMALLGGAAIVVDHSGLGDTGRARGTSDKDRAVDFVAVMKVVSGRVGKRGVSGEYELQCTKDRDSRFIGDSMKLLHEAHSDGTFTYYPEGWGDELEGIGDAPTQSRMYARIAELGRTVTVREMADWLEMDYGAVRSAFMRGSNGVSAVFVKVGRGEYGNRSGDRSA
jgi:hypothetical protein